ncbi:MAG: hypothetical protein K5682_00920 [Lachnospiraceae bacterium]|nr:hypothetical protein [Lachnospiraceae bacterium]
METVNKIKTYEAPEGANLRKDYIVKIRPEGEKKWTYLPVYRVTVDMHDKRCASMVYFDFTGKVEVEVEIAGYYEIYRVDIRPLSLGIQSRFGKKTASFTLDHPVNISVEFNKERFHNLHLFAGQWKEEPVLENALTLRVNENGVGFVGEALNEELRKMPRGRTVRLTPGIYYAGEAVWHLPSHTDLYLEGGAILVGGLALDHVSHVHIYGKGILYLADYHRYTGINGIRAGHSSHLCIEDVIFIDPPHYTVHLGDCEDVTIRRIKSFSCEGWSDGVDMMSCRRVLVEDCFLRNSDDCIAIYGSRWDNYGDTRDITFRNMVLWADVAHPINIGSHGDHAHEGDVLEHILIENIDVLEHHEFQKECLGVMALNVGDKNTVQHVTFRNFRIEPFEHGKLLNFQIKCSPKYNPAPGHAIKDVRVENVILTSGSGEEISDITGYSEEYQVEKVRFSNIVRDGKRASTLEEAGIRVGEYVKDVSIQ